MMYDPESEKLTGGSEDRYDKNSMANDKEENPVPLNPQEDEEKEQADQPQLASEQQQKKEEKKETTPEPIEDEEEEEKKETPPLELQANGFVAEGKELEGRQLAEAFKAVFSDWLGLPQEQAEAFDEGTQKIALHVYTLCKTQDDHLNRKGWILGYIAENLPDSKDKDLNSLNKKLESKLAEQYKSMTGRNITDADIQEAKDLQQIEMERELRGEKIEKFIAERISVTDHNGEKRRLEEWAKREDSEYWGHELFDGREGLQLGLQLARFADIYLSESEPIKEGKSEKWNDNRLRNQLLIWNERIEDLHKHTEWCEKQVRKQARQREKLREDLRMVGTGNEPDMASLKKKEAAFARIDKRLLLAKQREEVARNVKLLVLEEAERTDEQGKSVYKAEKIFTGDDIHAESVLERRPIDQLKLKNTKVQKYYTKTMLTLWKQETPEGVSVRDLHQLWEESLVWQSRLFQEGDKTKKYTPGVEYNEDQLAVLKLQEKLKLALEKAGVNPLDPESVTKAMDVEKKVEAARQEEAKQAEEQRRTEAERKFAEQRAARERKEAEERAAAEKAESERVQRQDSIQQEVNASITDQRQVLSAIEEQHRIFDELKRSEPDWNKLRDPEAREKARGEWLAQRDEAMMRLSAVQNRLLEMGDPTDFGDTQDRLRWVREKNYAEKAKADAQALQEREAGRRKMEYISGVVGMDRSDAWKQYGELGHMTKDELVNMSDGRLQSLGTSSKAPEIEYVEKLIGHSIPEEGRAYTVTDARERFAEFQKENSMPDYDLVREIIMYSKEGQRNITIEDIKAVNPSLTETQLVAKAKELTEAKLRYSEFGQLTESQLSVLRQRRDIALQNLKQESFVHGNDMDYKLKILAATAVLAGNKINIESLRKSPGGQEERPHDYVVRLTNLYGDVIRDDALVRKIFYTTDEEESRYFESEFYRGTPHSIEDMAWQIAHAYQRGEGEFGRKGEHATYKKRIMLSGDGNNLTTEVRDVVNTANLTLWLRSEVTKHYEQDTESAINFFEKVQIDKGSRLNNISIQDIINAGSIFFTSRYKDEGKGGFRKYDFLNDEWQRELTILMVAQRYRVELTKATDEEQVMKLFAELTATNVFTKRIWGRSFFYWLSTMSSSYFGNDSDGKLGGMINTLQQAHFHLANAEALKNVFGMKTKEELNDLFGKEAFVKVYRSEINRSRRAAGEKEVTSDAEAEALLRAEIIDDKGTRFTDFYDANGKINNYHEFFSVAVNVWGEASMNHHIYDAVRRLLTDKAASIHRVDAPGINKGIGQLLGISMAAFEGAWVHNDPNGRGYKPEQRVGNLAYRLKQGGGQRGGRGNYYMLSAIRSLYIPPMYSLHTEERIEGRGQNAATKSLIDVMEDVTASRIAVNDALEDLDLTYYGKDREGKVVSKGRIAVLEDELFGRNQPLGADGQPQFPTDERKREIVQTIRQFEQEYEDKKRSIYENARKVATQFEFKTRSLERWWADCARRVYQLEPIVGDAAEFDFGSYLKVDQYGDVVIDKAKMQADFVKKVITPLRYLLKSYGELNYNQPIWWYDPFKKEYRNMPLLEVMLGPELFEREIEKNGKKENMMKFDEASGKWAVDTTLINDNPEALLEQAVGAILVATWLQHIDRQENSTDPRYEAWLKMAIREFLEKIPRVEFNEDPSKSGIDPLSMKRTRLQGGYFSKEALDWMFEHGEMTIPNIFIEEIFHALTKGKKGDPKRQLGFEGLFEMLGVFVSEIAKSH